MTRCGTTFRAWNILLGVADGETLLLRKRSLRTAVRKLSKNEKHVLSKLVMEGASLLALTAVD